MAVLTFDQRYKADTRFKNRVDGILMEAIFAMAGINAEALCRAWEAGDHALRFEDVAEPPQAQELKPEPAPKKQPTRRSTKKADAATGDDK